LKEWQSKSSRIYLISRHHNLSPPAPQPPRPLFLLYDWHLSDIQKVLCIGFLQQANNQASELTIIPPDLLKVANSNTNRELAGFIMF
jgi:hypothetical protein